ncbi:MAG: hypothetical protein IGR76_01445 [Synechococcales cyanobacterium T60_A2020_003]|nr:hypothetical protein [Synechococcales cyanobacterium T60_A2020_003]
MQVIQGAIALWIDLGIATSLGHPRAKLGDPEEGKMSGMVEDRFVGIAPL